ncbi:cysteine--tRNA ligase [Novosphingobium sp.]|jgi:cysteinyl-tRNA synthetase|uniref:cysteine--tRNA ligase n=1 Tax=Novosphingobium sp. TaxID=1874826 RepID=UPI0022BB5115|nr:cysteine--tRNA ligase [Novosphingobium sp.]MCZ8019681.1 cysteine--tRNA ligase [Novosphingobium sp.]MCZ8035496.1 cysteine--tRNA ligase [Novosphingobium sp.]MCZ8050810.1 cysteine--tRNA ligase [Novosphingobium sp.]MCZ8059156.1 cysteine--tRNA ligase [Novosphingobium sp.]MCZ8232602.1 cysteine--tRNA ligase [Novosphingobium sp.]
MTTTPLKLFNSLTRQLEEFQPVHPGEARVYTCGPTVYNYPHIGNMRAYVFADVLGRTLSFKGYKLTHVINITDVGHLTDDADAGEDKMEKMAAERAQSIWDIAQHYTEAYWADVKALGIRQPAKWTIATEYVPAMIDFAKSIADKHCYELDSGLYFDVTTVADYGRLARAVTEEGEGRIDEVEGKRNAADFAIWRKTPPGEKRQMEWDSPWGRGAPGWHLECSVMSGQVLGFPFDIHTGGIDHREIHHPNEIAQNQAFCCTNGLDVPANSGANIWMHNNFLVERSGKMSKSAGEFLRLQLLIDKGYHPLAYRLMCLQAHYRSELEFSWEGLQAALVRLKRMVMAWERLAQTPPKTAGSPTAMEQILSNHETAFAGTISEDLNTAVALTVFEELLADKKISSDFRLDLLRKFDAVLGFEFDNLSRTDLRIRPKAATITEAEIEAVLTQRKEARAAKDFATSDRLRDELAAQGVEVMDGDPLGWDWKLGE